MNNDNWDSDAGEQAKQKAERLFDSPVQSLLIIIGTFLVLFSIFHHVENRKAEAIFESSYRLPQAHQYVNLIRDVEGEMIAGVFDLATGKLIDETYYFKDEAGIIKISPDQKYRIKGSFGWRFFKSGLFYGEKYTSFTLHHWQLGSTRMDGKPTSLLRRIYFDPTNPTPFYVLLVLFIISSLALLLQKK